MSLLLRAVPLIALSLLWCTQGAWSGERTPETSSPLGRFVSAVGESTVRHGEISLSEGGTVQYHDNHEAASKPNAPFFSGDIIATKSTSRAKIMIGSTVIADLSPDTVVSFDSVNPKKTRLLLLQGKVRVLITAHGEFSAATPLARSELSSQSGEFVLAHTLRSTTELTVIGGSLRVRPLASGAKPRDDRTALELRSGDRFTVLHGNGEWKNLANAELKRVKLSNPELEATVQEASYLSAHNPDFLPAAPTGFVAPNGKPLELSGVSAPASHRGPASLTGGYGNGNEDDQIQAEENPEAPGDSRSWSHTNTDPTVAPAVNLPTQPYRRLSVPVSP